MPNGFIVVTAYNYRGKINWCIYNNSVMVHGIAQLAIFSNGLFGLRIRIMIGNFISSGIYRVGVGIYHKLPCAKAKQQYPGKDNMVFIFFHSAGQFVTYGKSS